MPRVSPRSAFTLTELLVVMSIFGVLSGLLLALQTGTRRKGQQVNATSQMRQVGLAVLAKVADNDQVLPGPLWPGQVPTYDSSRTGRLPVELAPYLGLSTNAGIYVVKLFVPPAYPAALPPGVAVGDGRTYVMNMQVATSDGRINPWGSLAAGGGLPMRLSQIPHPSSTWAFSDADQLHPQVASAPWRTSTPSRPLQKDRRNALFFDGHVESLPLGAFALP